MTNKKQLPSWSLYCFHWCQQKGNHVVDSGLCAIPNNHLWWGVKRGLNTRIGQKSYLEFCFALDHRYPIPPKSWLSKMKKIWPIYFSCSLLLILFGSKNLSFPKFFKFRDEDLIFFPVFCFLSAFPCLAKRGCHPPGVPNAKWTSTSHKVPPTKYHWKWIKS